MICHYIGIFQNQELVGISLSQFLDLNKLESFGERDKCIKASVRNFLFKKFSSHVLVIGNNMLTGQNAFSFLDTIDSAQALKTLKLACEALKKDYNSKGKKVHITTYKDFWKRKLKNLLLQILMAFLNFLHNQICILIFLKIGKPNRIIVMH